MMNLKISLRSACLFLAVTAAGAAAAEVAAPVSARAQTPAAPPASSVGATEAMATPPPAVIPAAGPSPYQLNLLYTGELWDNASGGIREGTMYMYNIDGRLSVDTGRAFGWTGGRFVLEGFFESQPSLNNSYVGALDEQSPIDTALSRQMLRLYQVYYDQILGNTDILFGIYDLESEFSVTKPMSLFLSKNLTWNTALDQSGTMPQNGSIGPGNYPYTPLALRVRETISQQWSIQAVIADGAADDPNNQVVNGIYFSSRYGALMMGEVDYTPSLHTKVMAGLWGLTSKLPTNDMFNPDGSPREVYGQEGGYVGGATRLLNQQGRRGLDAFFTLGVSSPRSTNVAQSLNGGLVYTGLLAARPLDKAGVSFNVNANPASYRDAQIALGHGVDRYETSFELTYRARICSWLTVQPDMQYIINPNYDPTLRNDFLIGLHFEIGHLFDL